MTIITPGGTITSNGSNSTFDPTKRGPNQTIYTQEELFELENKKLQEEVDKLEKEMEERKKILDE